MLSAKEQRFALALHVFDGVLSSKSYWYSVTEPRKKDYIIDVFLDISL